MQARHRLQEHSFLPRTIFNKLLLLGSDAVKYAGEAEATRATDAELLYAALRWDRRCPIALLSALRVLG